MMQCIRLSPKVIWSCHNIQLAWVTQNIAMIHIANCVIIIYWCSNSTGQNDRTWCEHDNRNIPLTRKPENFLIPIGYPIRTDLQKQAT